MGDVILATPLVRQLHRTYPDARIDVCVQERFADVWRFDPHVHTVWEWDVHDPDATADDLKLSMREHIEDSHYDLIVDLQNNIRSRILRKGLGRHLVSLEKHRLEKLALVLLKRRPAVITPIVDRYRATVRSLPLVQDVEGAEVWTAADKQLGYYAPSARRAATAEIAAPRIAIAAGAHHFTKRWPADRFAALCTALHEQMGASFVLLGGPDDVQICDAIAQQTSAPIERADGATSIFETIAALDTCQLAITNDTGVMHLAAARRLPIVAIFGSSVVDLGFAPYGVPATIVQADVPCRPCSHIGRSSCPKGHFHCMTQIDPDRVLVAVKDFVKLRT